MNAVIVPESVPVFRRVDAGVAQDSRAALHALQELDRKTEHGCLGKVERGKSAMGEGDVDCALRLSGIPMLAGGDHGKQPADQRASTCSVFKMQEDIARERQVIAAQDEALNIGLVELTHFCRQS